MTLQAGAYLRVFASRKDRKSDTDFLHINFSLSSEGEYLALIRPDGGTIADEYAPNYPPQILEISYGLGNGRPILETNILPLGAPLSYFVPFEEIGDDWKTVNFDVSSWTQSASAVGYGYDDKPPVAALISPNGNTKSVMRRINASIYLRFPFQIVNPDGVDSLTLKFKIDDGFVAFLNGVEVASRNRPDGQLEYDSDAVGGEEVEIGEEYDTATLDISGNLLAGDNMLAVQAMNGTVGSNDFIFISELDGEIQDLTPPFPRGYFETPTPAAPNGAPSLPPPSGVEFDITSQAFAEDFQLNLSVAEPQATIRYTTNGDKVTKESQAYTGPILIAGSTLVRARAFLPGSLPGPGSTQGYMKLGSEADFSSDIPVVLLSTFSNGPPPASGATDRKDVFMLIYEPDPETGRTTLEGTPALATRGGFRKRGSSSANFPKYGMSFESWDEDDNDKDIEPLGLAPEADWILNTRYTFDLSLIRNPFIYDISNQINRWAVKTRFVELGGFNSEVRKSVAEEDLIGSFCVEAFSGASIEF
ncbi:chitobiase/beta-hexosaminidase C-terminal domain-containing protein [bacterium]|nr:chitobiase/beta-hexosaminidase C-terminal domain-containing protein [bacterium]